MAVTVHAAQLDKTQSPYKLDPVQTLRASQALLGHVRAEAKKLSKQNEKRNLLAASGSDEDEDAPDDDQEPIWLNISTKQQIVDKIRLKPSKISVPYPLQNTEHTSICLITADPQRAVKDAVGDPSFPTTLSTRINRIIGLDKLQARCKSFEQKRQLFSEHDIFLADDRIVTRLPGILGKTFYKGTAKRPIPINLAPRVTEGEKKAKKNMKKPPKDERHAEVAEPTVVAKEIEKALKCIPVSLQSGPVISARIGLASFTAEQVSENVCAVVPAIIEKHVVKGWRNVRSIHVKSPNSVALPVWLSSELTTGPEDVLDGMTDEAKGLENSDERDEAGKKRKRNINTTKGPQTGERKKARMLDEQKKEKDETEQRKRSLSSQKVKAFKI